MLKNNESRRCWCYFHLLLLGILILQTHHKHHRKPNEYDKTSLEVLLRWSLSFGNSIHFMMSELLNDIFYELTISGTDNFNICMHLTVISLVFGGESINRVSASVSNPSLMSHFNVYNVFQGQRDCLKMCTVIRISKQLLHFALLHDGRLCILRLRVYHYKQVQFLMWSDMSHQLTDNRLTNKPKLCSYADDVRGC